MTDNNDGTVAGDPSGEAPSPSPKQEELEPAPIDKSWIEMDDIRGGGFPPGLESR